jgi:hypothetical protein
MTQTIGKVRYRNEMVEVLLDVWTAGTRKLYTPRCSAFGLGGRDFAQRAAAVRYAKRVTGMQ